MGHREDLLAGAKKCLVEKGFAHTTARDLVAASGTNLASIGYHFGSKDALLTEAMVELVGEWGTTFAKAASEAGAADGEARFRATWRALLKLFETDRPVLMASFEIATQAVRSPELRGIFASAWQDARQGLPEDFVGDQGFDARTNRAVGGVLLALISGMTLQYLIDPEGAPSATELTAGLKAIAAAF